MFFLIGCLSVLMGLLAEVMMRTYYESSRAPTYLVREVYQRRRCRAAFAGPRDAAERAS